MLTRPISGFEIYEAAASYVVSVDTTNVAEEGLIMFRLALVSRLRTVQHGLVFRANRQLQCGVNSETVDHSLRKTKEVLLRDPPARVAGFRRVKVESPLMDKLPLSAIEMHVGLVVRLYFFVFIAYVFAN